MEDNHDWLENNKTWKKWTRIGEQESLSYARINFHKTIDEERICFTKIIFVINMEDKDDWLENNKTWKKWIRIGDGESLSYAGNNVHKTIDEDQLV